MDDGHQAWAHQEELLHRRIEEDPAFKREYEAWLDSLEREKKPIVKSKQEKAA
jgi:hypothetical protein